MLFSAKGKEPFSQKNTLKRGFHTMNILDYIDLGFWYMRHILPLGIAAWLVWTLFLQLTGRRDIRRLSQLPRLNLLWEFLFILYSATILNITGVLGGGLEFEPEHLLGNLAGLVQVPFVGGSLKMILLNILLFVPFGFLLPLALSEKRWSWGKAWLTGMGCSLTIEIIQVFVGRYCELDDILANGFGTLVGFLLWQVCAHFFREKNHIRALGHAVLALCGIFCMICGLTFLLSLVADGDQQEAQLAALYPGMGNEEDWGEISSVYLYVNRSKTDFDTTISDWEYWYSSIGIDIGNGMSQYVELEQRTTAQEICEKNSGLYVEIFYNTPQTFKFYNNPLLAIVNAEHLLYCLDNGTIWYGSAGEELTHCITYTDTEHPFQQDKEVYQGLLNSLT
jgi:glycopeptide antibiotics resistance protein